MCLPDLFGNLKFEWRGTDSFEYRSLDHVWSIAVKLVKL